MLLSNYFTHFKGINSNSWLLSFCLFINRMGSMLIPFLSIYLSDHLKFEIEQTGFIIASYGVGGLLGSFLGGYLTDVIGFYKTQVLSLTLAGIGFISLYSIQTPLSFGVALAVLGLVNELFRPANQVATVAYAGEHPIKAIALNRLANNLGYVIGSSLGGVLLLVNVRLLFYIDGATALLSAVLIGYFFRNFASFRTPKKGDSKSYQMDFSVYRDVIFLIFVGLTSCFGILFFQYLSLVPLYYKEIWHLSPFQVGTTLTLNGCLIVALELPLVTWLNSRFQHLYIIAMGLCGIGLSFGLLALAPPSYPIALLCASLFTLGEMGCMSFLNSFWIDRATPSNKGQYAGLISVAFAVAHIFSPIIGTQLIKAQGYEMLFLLATMTTFMVAFLFFLLKRFTTP